MNPSNCISLASGNTINVIQLRQDFADAPSDLHLSRIFWMRFGKRGFLVRSFKSLDAFEDTLIDALVALENDQNRTQCIAVF